jgi:hypothetical protein
MQRAEGIHQPNLINRLTFRFAQSGRAEYERQPQPDERCSEWFTTNSIQSLFAAVGTNLGPALGFVEVASWTTGMSFRPNMVAASTRPCPTISSPSSATMQGTVHPNFAMLAAIFAT